MVAHENQQDEALETAVPSDEPPAHEQIALLAHALWQQRGCPEGSPEEDWFRAERQLHAGSET
jgi:hypothetical protein